MISSNGCLIDFFGATRSLLTRVPSLSWLMCGGRSWKNERRAPRHFRPFTRNRLRMRRKGDRTGRGDITWDPSLRHSPPHEHLTSTDENVHSDVIGLHTYQTENHPEEHSEQSITNNIPVVQDLVGEKVANRHSVPYDTEHTQG